MKILVVEDDLFKFSRVAELLKEIFSEIDLIHHDNVFGAVNYLRSEVPDLIVLDMSLPSHPAVAGEGSPVSMPAGGIEIILELKILGKTLIPTVVLTQYPDVEIEFEYYAIENAAGIINSLYEIKKVWVVHYDNESPEWRETLTEVLRTKNEISVD